MRADYGLYVLAIICFIIAALPYTNAIPESLLTSGSAISITVTVIFAALGLIFVILGYSQRPKPIISTLETLQPALPPSPPSQPSTEEAAEAPPSEPAPSTPPQEETAEPEGKKPKTRARRKRTRKRRKKA